jgi:15-hydroxyprostaglandin dehydrogenase (NAD)
LDSDAGENAVEELGRTYGTDRVLFCHCDVTDYVQFEEAFQTTKSNFSALDIVINNAEIMNDKFWELEVDVNLVR